MTMSYSTGSRAKNLGHKKGGGSPITRSSASGRGMNPVKKPRSSSAGMQGLSIGKKVPMQIFKNTYQAPNPHGGGKIVDANTIKRGTKSALKGKQKQFFGL